jgi:predicted RNA-binding Zn-ribbon protein involved in translation (DUF1610 family)
MADRKPGLFARLLGPETAAAMEAESRAWMVVCTKCGFTRSVWETGGTRYKASGTSRVRIRCPSCGETGWNRIEKGPNFPTTSGPTWPLVRLIIVMVLLILLLVGGFLFALFKFIP